MSIEKTEEQFRKEFDELGLKPPKGSMPGLERELIIDFWRKALTQTRIDTLKEVDEWVDKRKKAHHKECLEDVFINGRFWEDVDLLTHIQSLLDKK